MRYRIDGNNYITDVYFNCHSGYCTAYVLIEDGGKGTIPDGYISLEDWAENANIRAYKIVDGNLVFDPNRDEILRTQFEKEEEDNRYVCHKEISNLTNIVKSDNADNYLTSISKLSNLVEVTDSNKFASTNIKLLANENVTNKVNIKFNNGNLLTNDATSKNESGISFGVNSDKTININGTATNDIEYDIGGTPNNTKPILALKKDVDYCLSGLENEVEITSENHLYLENSNGKDLKELNIDGKSEQETRSGKNLFKGNITSMTSYGLTSSYSTTNSNEVTISGVATNSWANISKSVTDGFSAGTYTLSINNSQNFNVSIKGSYEDDSILEYAISPDNLSKTFTATKNIKSFYVFIWGLTTGNQYNTKFKIQLEKGSTATEIEEYGATPSPDYPSEIESVGEYDETTGKYKIDVNVTGKNLYNYKDTAQVTSGYTVDKDGWITISYDNTSGSSVKYFNYYTHNLNLKTSTNYRIVTEVKNVEGNGQLFSVSQYNTSGQFEEAQMYNFSTSTSNSIYFTTRTTFDSFENVGNAGIRTYVSFQAGQSGSITFRLSVLEDTTVNASTFKYEPYKSNTTQLILDEPLRSLPNGVKDTYENGVITRRIGRVVLDGSENWYSLETTTSTDYLYVFTSSYDSLVANNNKGLSNKLQNYNDILKAGSSVNTSVFSLGGSSNRIRIFIPLSIASTVDEFKTWLSQNNVEVIYELAEPITENVGEIKIPTFKGINIINVTSNIEISGVSCVYTEPITTKMYNYDGTDRTEIYNGDGGVINFTDSDKLVTQIVAYIPNEKTLAATIKPMLNVGSSEKEYITYQGNETIVYLGENTFYNGDNIKIEDGKPILQNEIYIGDNLIIGDDFIIGGDLIELEEVNMPITYTDLTYMYCMEDVEIQTTYPNLKKNNDLTGYETPNGNFAIDEQGNMYCNNATIQGSAIVNGGNFRVDKDGNMTCGNAEIMGGSINLTDSNKEAYQNPMLNVYGNLLVPYDVSDINNHYIKEYRTHYLSNGSSVYCNNDGEEHFVDYNELGTNIEIWNNDSCDKALYRYNRMMLASDYDGRVVEITPTEMEFKNTEDTADKIKLGNYGNDPFINVENSSNASVIYPYGMWSSSFNNNSLESKKKNIELDDGCLEEILNSDITSFNWNYEDDEDKKHIGLIIPDKGGNYRVSPKVLTHDKDAVDLYSMNGMAWKGIQELYNIVKEQQEKIKELEEKLNGITESN